MEYVVDAKGRVKSVLLRVAEYRRLLCRLEDLEDARALDKAVSTARRFRDYADIRAEVCASGKRRR